MLILFNAKFRAKLVLVRFRNGETGCDLFSWRTVRDIALIVLGTSVYGFGLVYLNIPNDLAEGGVTGITLIMRALWDINPAYSTLILNIPIILLGGKILGRRSLVYTVIGTFGLSFC